MTAPYLLFVFAHISDTIQFGRVEDVINDCCGYCPTPVTDEEKEIAEEEAKIYVSGMISFMKDDPGRQVSQFRPYTPRNLNSSNTILDNWLLQSSHG